MKRNTSLRAVPGWVGGFAESNPAFAYPDPDLSSLPIQDNMDNIPKIRRQQAVYWPEFSWQTKPGDEESRCFQMFAHDISRLGYDDTGRVWSIICPQQGFCVPDFACLNVEVTVTGQRGWADERNMLMAADMSVDGTIWFSPSSHASWFVKTAWKLFNEKGLPFPSTKENAMKVTTHAVGEPDQPLFKLRSGQTQLFNAPEFAKHPEAWDVSNLSVQIGPLRPTGNDAADRFNQKVLDIFNIGSGNMLVLNNVLTWDVWFTAPEFVDTQEWATHAARWRKAIQADHGPQSSPARYADGTEFSVVDNIEKEIKGDLEDELKKLLDDLKAHL